MKHFIATHRNDDVRTLALQASRYPHIDMAEALQQITGYRKALHKLPTWAATEGILFPPDIAMQQCSSEATAHYKASLVRGDSLVDLTGGFGVDCSVMARNVANATYVERQETLCDIARHNFDCLGLNNVSVVCDNAEHFLEASTEPFGTIYLDPARRDGHGNRTYAIADCTPNVAVLAPTLTRKASRVIIKLSPMLDISQGVRELACVTQVHVVSSGGECKEVLFVLERDHADRITLVCADDKGTFTCELNGDYPPSPLLGNETAPHYLYEPNPSIMKAGCFGALAQRFGVQAVGRNSHLFVSHALIEDFPGRTFAIDAITTMNKKDLKRHLAGIDRANVSTRNFPMTAAQLAKRLHLADGGDTYIFGTTTAAGEHRLFITHK